MTPRMSPACTAIGLTAVLRSAPGSLLGSAIATLLIATTMKLPTVTGSGRNTISRAEEVASDPCARVEKD